MKPIAIVIPWFGSDLKGGAEQLSWQVATRLAARGHAIEVLTTCCRAFHEDWATNHLSPGLSYDQGVAIRRFRVDSRNRKAFDQVNALMLNLPHFGLKLGVNPVSQNDSAIFVKENINSFALLSHLKKHRENYHAFIFIPYLYGPTINGLSLVAKQAFLQPCLHDEVYAYLSEIEYIFHKAKGLLLNSEGEALLAERLYGPGIIRKSIVMGTGVEVCPRSGNGREKIGPLELSHVRFVLCLGRRDPTKNTDLLVRAYERFKNRHPDSNLQLVLAGPGSISFEGLVDGVVDLGLMKEEEKDALLFHCLALCHPSRNESYSRVIMEAWLHGRPVAVHRECLATATAVERARGGWLAGTETEWADVFLTIDSMDERILAEYGEKGRTYAKENAVWDKVIDRYEKVLGLSGNAFEKKPKRFRKLKEIHQLVPNLAYGDAISNHALAMRDYLRSLGYESDIFVQYLDERVANKAKVFKANAINKKAGLLYHHSIGSELTSYAVEHPGPNCLIYHNITPSKYFEPYRPDFAKILEHGLSDLKQLSSSFSLSVGDSAYNASELKAHGFENSAVLPIAVNPCKWNHPPDSDLMVKLQDGKANLLFVGRIAPNKCQDHLVIAFWHYLTMDPKARLIIVGKGTPGDSYCAHLANTIDKYGLTQHVVLAGQVNDSELHAYYRTADLLWSMSEHEGFCLPLIEAMWFDVPVLAYKSTAVPETLGEAGIMFTSKEDLVSVAALAKLLARDEDLRTKVLRAQRRRRIAFLPESVLPKLDELIASMESQLK